jgi:hypothetical protein
MPDCAGGRGGLGRLPHSQLPGIELVSMYLKEKGSPSRGGGWLAFYATGSFQAVGHLPDSELAR